MSRGARLAVLVVALIAVVLFAGVPVRAQHMNQKDSPCANIAQTAELAGCLAKARDLSDAKLNSFYKNLRKRLDASDVERLTATQRLWIQYRDANCSAEQKLYEGGTASFPAYLACLEAMTRMRIKELEVTYAVKLK